MRLGRLHVVTDTRPGRDPLTVVRLALGAGAPVIQVRAKDGTDRELFELAAAIQRLCVESSASCVVNDRADLAVAVGAAGVHLGEDDLPVEAARRVVGEHRWVGASVRDPGTARVLEERGATYLGVGPAYRTGTKEGLPDPLGAGGIEAVARAVSIPVIAIGGVTAERVPELLEAGAYGVAVVSAVSEADDPAAATRELLDALEARRPDGRPQAGRGGLGGHGGPEAADGLVPPTSRRTPQEGGLGGHGGPEAAEGLVPPTSRRTPQEGGFGGHGGPEAPRGSLDSHAAGPPKRRNQHA